MKKILIVGATSGIGRRVAEIYAARPDTVVGVMGRRTALLDELTKAFPERCLAAPCDVAGPTDALLCAVNEMAKRMEGIDCLFLAAGTGDVNPDLDYRLECPALYTNVVGWTCLVDWALHYFQQQGRGHLAVITSVGGLRGQGGAAAYSATKAFQINYVEGLRCWAYHFAPFVRITEIRPGFVDTDMAKGEGLFWVVPLENACRQIVKALEKGQNLVYVSRRWRWVAAVWRHLPLSFLQRMRIK